MHASSLRAFALVALLGIAPQVIAGTKILASGAMPVGESAGCSNEEGFVVEGEEGLVVTTATCNGTPRGWLSKAPAPGQKMANTDSALVLDRLSLDKPLRTGQRLSSGPYCSVDGKEVQWLAVYDWRKRKKVNLRNGGLRQAWVVDAAARRFAPAPKPLLERASCQAGGD